MDQKKEFYVGIDIGRDRAMISLYRDDQKEPETISTVRGMEKFGIPLVMFLEKKGTTYYYAVRAGIKTSGGKGEPFRKAVIVGQRGIIGIVRTCPHAEVRPLVGEGRFGVHLNQSAHGIAPVERALRTA